MKTDQKRAKRSAKKGTTRETARPQRTGREPREPRDTGSGKASGEIEPTGGTVGTDLAGSALSAESQSIIKTVSRILQQAVHANASDIHIEQYEHRSRLRFRIDGLLREVEAPPAELFPALISRLQIMANLETKTALPQDGRIRIRMAQKEYDIRLSFARTVVGQHVVLRFLATEQVDLDMKSLGRPAIGRRLTQWSKRPDGLCLVTGPTGCGKTTTLYAMLKPLAANPTLKVMTVEDPVEYLLDGACQIPENPKGGVTMPSALRHMLRSAPNVLMVSDLRDTETVDMAIAAAMTGHLVLGAMHTNNAVSAVTRLRDLGVDPYRICNCLVGVAAQRLLRRLCPHCRKKGKPDPMLLDALGVKASRRPKVVYRPGGCAKCNGTGYRGRVAAFELYEPGEEIYPLLQQDAPTEQLRKLAVENGFKTLIDDGIALVREKQTSLEELARILLGT
ncbi:MAG: type II/IV secretion system protein [Kiritimatiellae bacterium]|nr:type II/IV secretion system protein [Kiritimatiellia bacterium]